MEDKEKKAYEKFLGLSKKDIKSLGAKDLYALLAGLPRPRVIAEEVYDSGITKRDARNYLSKYYALLELTGEGPAKTTELRHIGRRIRDELGREQAISELELLPLWIANWQVFGLWFFVIRF